MQRATSAVSTPPRPRSAAFLSSPKPSLSPRALSGEGDRRLEGRKNNSLSLASDAKGGVNRRRSFCEGDTKTQRLCFEVCEEDVEVQRLEDLLFEATALFFFFSPAVAFAVAWRLPLPAFEERAKSKTEAGTPLASPVFSATACVASGTRRGEETAQTLSSREQRHLLPMQILAEIELLAHGSTARAVINFDASERLLARQRPPQTSRLRSGLEEWFAASLLPAPLAPPRASVEARRGEPREETVSSTRRHITSSASCGELVERRLSRLLLLLALVCTSEGRKKKENGLREAVRERDAAPFGVAIAALKSLWRLAATQDHLRRVVLVFLQRCLLGPQSLSFSPNFFSLPRPPVPSFSSSAPSSGVSPDVLLRCRLNESGLLDALLAASLDALERRDALFLPSSSSRCYGSGERGGLRVSRAGSPLPADALATLLFLVAASVSAKSEKRTELLGFAAQLASHLKALLSAFVHEVRAALPQQSSLHASASAHSRSPRVSSLASAGASGASSPRLAAPHAEPTAAFEARLVGCLHCLRAICGVGGVAEDCRSLSCLFAASPLLSICGDRGPVFAEVVRDPQGQGDLSGWPSRCMQSPRLDFATKGHYATQAEIRETIDLLASALLVPSLSFASLAALLAFLAACVGGGSFAAAFASPLSKSARLLLLSSKVFLTVPAFLLSYRFSPALLDREKERERERGEEEGEHKGSRREQRRLFFEGGTACLHASQAGREGLRKEKREKEDFLFWRAGLRSLLELLLATVCVDRRVAGGAQKMQKPTLCAALRIWRSRLSESAESHPKSSSEKRTFSPCRVAFDTFACRSRNGGEGAEDSKSDREDHRSLADRRGEQSADSDADPTDETLLHLVSSVMENI
ncbi:putative transmembrane protein [Toxoplasma gondii MAS]|uniref:Putative transmembrane protein n=1 Tax=Toxoplasma gondii MAS TaxID=943118 RepID=A0A086QWH1_TOXGO|nr:putative transmembrane protein [Toxoplasma gondii MAS]